MSERERLKSGNSKRPSSNSHEHIPSSRSRAFKDKDDAIVLSPGDYFGECGCLGYSKRTENAITQSTCVLFTMNTENFRLLLNTAPDVKTKFLLAYLENLNAFTERSEQYDVLESMQLSHLCDPNDLGLRDNWKTVITEARKDEKPQSELEFMDNAGSSDPVLMNMKMGFTALWNNQDSLRQEMTKLGKQLELLRSVIMTDLQESSRIRASAASDSEHSSPKKTLLDIETELVENEQRQTIAKDMQKRREETLSEKRTLRILDEVARAEEIVAEGISDAADVPPELEPTTFSTDTVSSTNNVDSASEDAVNAKPALSGVSEIEDAELSSHQL
ncbi:hypothetical protein CYMTET_13377 [Cymbomonas tetramitiformis]|uniref:Cyclic nucleotide-binding domain-containing protein n=1 Tax=Cymbomonas tetramitiformis TaxID=36881 RepID=A0AAE0LAY5_9CHLO|nr:hypothetical protein CYMTET_13377 [Cymbomonas tetramitiformis]